MECFSLKTISLNSLLAGRAWQQSLVICLCHLRSNTALLLACCCPISCPPNFLPERWAKNGEQWCKVNWENILQSSKTIKGRTSISSSGLFFVLFEKQRKLNFLKSAQSWMTHADRLGTQFTIGDGATGLAHLCPSKRSCRSPHVYSHYLLLGGRVEAFVHNFVTLQ